MNTPICDFVRGFAESDPARFHMPGHKGKGPTGAERIDITELPGADVLYPAKGIILESEKNAASIYGSARTIYSAEGSSLCIRAMVYLAMQYAKLRGRKPLIAAGRNAHKTFLSALALCDIEVRWIFPRVPQNGEGSEGGAGILSCIISPEELEELFMEAEEAGRDVPTAVYVTSPDYLGQRSDIAGLSGVCRRHGALLIVDNAHGAYLKFAAAPREAGGSGEGSMHPLDLGADLCCDSSHKTLSVLTGGAYLHISKGCPEEIVPMAERGMQLFASTSPSYVILQSLDYANREMASGYRERVAEASRALDKLKAELKASGWRLIGDEPLKLTLMPKSKGYTGEELAEILQKQGLYDEFSDPDYLVYMFSASNTAEEIAAIGRALGRLEAKAEIAERPPTLPVPERVMSPREAMLSPFENVPVGLAEGRVLATPSVGCPPAVPIAISGERIGREAAELFAYYGIESVDVVLKEFEPGGKTRHA